MNVFLPGFEPDFDVRQELRFIGGMPDLHQFDFVFISCSGGKDSHSMAYLLSELASRQNYEKTKMELIYADTGLEWHDTFDQVERIGAAVGVKAVTVLPKYKLLDNVRRRWAKFNGMPDDWQTTKSEDTRQTDRQSRIDHSPANSQDFAPRRENRNSGINISNPFPRAHRRFCTGEGKNNAIQEFVRKKDKEGD